MVPASRRQPGRQIFVPAQAQERVAANTGPSSLLGCALVVLGPPVAKPSALQTCSGKPWEEQGENRGQNANQHHLE